jgi:hypothetical protein
MLPDVWDMFLSPLRGLAIFLSSLAPRLAPWAAFFRRFAAASLSTKASVLRVRACREPVRYGEPVNPVFGALIR